ncbi:hypothetical protein EJ05DRAFT_511545 [Pseudovirgaria hyperparasitica]|uniref:GST C-terminal domain-containing protein n=1 Tax=Pseudovirgaria hyperparasitica TaxID=470096 RepID=A0A6A6W6G3_9PEZI|nr:uncharacterized protein EJ05DRAFT_511545 [Pseudovirgaria hyperparasitica]KAF2757779.1 hypothetical protein EJ05DRAFT_511545 [Pseudovirgaria hyperparasitica]
MIDENIIWGTVYTRHSKDARTQWQKRFTKIEEWVAGGSGGRWLGKSPDGPTMPDFALAANVIYMKQMYNRDPLKGFARLERWFEEYMKHEDYTEEPIIPDHVRIGDDFEY